jgi:propanol-preferring alcohol dehydrogenase
VVPAALSAVDRGGTCAIAGIYLTAIPPLDYDKHLFQERNLCSVTSNTRGDATEFLTLAQRLAIRVTVSPYPFDQAGQALADLAGDRIHGAGVLIMDEEGARR